MKFEEKNIKNLYVINPTNFVDNRGLFRRHYCENTFMKKGIDFKIKQGNISENLKKNTLRGFHFHKTPSREDKLLSCVNGKAWNVTIDVRAKSSTYLEKFEFEISSKNRKSLFIPAGCANAFLTLEENTILHYYMGDYFNSEKDCGFRFDDPFFKISWPIEPTIISKKDLNLPYYKDN